jgi:hypothetical protein
LDVKSMLASSSIVRIMIMALALGAGATQARAAAPEPSSPEPWLPVPEVTWDALRERQVEVTLVSGDVHMGTLLSHDAVTVSVVTGTGHVVTLRKDDVAQVRIVAQGSVPTELTPDPPPVSTETPTETSSPLVPPPQACATSFDCGLEEVCEANQCVAMITAKEENPLAREEPPSPRDERRERRATWTKDREQRTKERERRADREPVGPLEPTAHPGPVGLPRDRPPPPERSPRSLRLDARTGAIIGYSLAGVGLGFGFAAEGLVGGESSVGPTTLGAVATLAIAAGVPLAYAGGRATRKAHGMRGYPGMRIASWITYGVALTDALFLIGLGISDTEVPHGIVTSVTILGVTSGVLMATDAILVSKQVPGASAKLPPRRVRALSFGLAPVGGGLGPKGAVVGFSGRF